MKAYVHFVCRKHFYKIQCLFIIKKNNEAISKFGGKLSPKISAKITLIL